MTTKYLFQIGTLETYIYDEFVQDLADNFNGKLKLETIKNAIKLLEEYGNKYYFQIDALCLLMHFMERDNIDTAFVIEKSEGL